MHVIIMVFILDGCSFHYAHIWSKSGISICLGHLDTAKESSNSILFLKKTLLKKRSKTSLLPPFKSNKHLKIQTLNIGAICSAIITSGGTGTRNPGIE